MRNRIISSLSIIFLLWTFFSFSSCSHGKQETVTRRIQYDVNIKSPNPSYDWWIQNLPGPQREHLVKTIIKGALSGKYKAYDYFYQPLTPKQVAQILTDTIAMAVRQTVPPYGIKDTLVAKHVNLRDILRLRFLEEWSYNPQTLQFTKKVKGIAPVLRVTDPQGNTAWQPLFWIFPNPETPRAMQQTQ